MDKRRRRHLLATGMDRKRRTPSEPTHGVSVLRGLYSDWLWYDAIRRAILDGVRQPDGVSYCRRRMVALDLSSSEVTL